MNFQTIDVAFSELKSTQVRRAVGARIFNTGLEATTNEQQQNGILGFIQGVLGGVRRLIGFIWQGISWLVSRINFSELWGTIQEATYAIAYFDWGQSDESIRSQITGNNNAMANLVGRFTGSGLVRIVSVGVAAGVALKYPVVAGRIALELAEDASGQLRGEFMGLLQGLRQLAIENGLMSLVLGFRNRRWFGQQPRPEDGPYDSFAQRIENTVQQIPIPALRSFVQGFLEGAEDAFWDVGYIIAGTLDDIVAANRYTNTDVMGPERVVKITPDVRNPEEAIVLAGPQQIVQANVDQTIATHNLVWNRDMGQIVGIPAEHYPRADRQTRTLVICYKDRAAPPWRTSQGRAKELFYSIPDAKRGLSWGEIKAAARRFIWGPYRATAYLDNNRQMAVYGNSPGEAEQQLRSLLQLSTASMTGLTVGEEKVRNPAVVKRPTPVFPCYATLILAPTDFQGQPIGGESARRRERRRIILWTDEEPDNLGALG
jgi:hypothetical protein